MTHRKKNIFFLLIFGLALNGVAQVPDNPEMDTVSIVGENPIISWIPNTQNTLGYSVYRGRYETAGGTTFLIFDSLTSLAGIQQSSFIDSQVSACTELRLYKISAYNANQSSNWLFADTMNTIFITDIGFDLCSNSVSLSWTKYRNMRGGMGGYRVLASIDGGDYEVVGTTSPSQAYFTHSNLLPDVQYSYKIRAFSQDESRSSTSCERSVNTQTYDKPLFNTINVASVENFDRVKISWETDEAPVTKYRIMRSATGSNFNMIDEIEDLTNYNPDTEYVDTSANVNETSYYYRIDVFDFCEKMSISTDNITRTILLSGQKASGSTIDLSWNPYEGWDNGVSGYEIYREVDGTPNPAGALGQVSGQENSYTDDVSTLTASEGNLAYYVKAIENSPGNHESLSNKVVLKLETSILIPNAIIPGGNPPENEFRPVLDFIEQGFYELTIFNKWGQQIFSTTNKDEGWKGTFNGEFVPAGTYVYMLRFRDARGETIEKRGTVTVVR